MNAEGPKVVTSLRLERATVKRVQAYLDRNSETGQQDRSGLLRQLIAEGIARLERKEAQRARRAARGL